MDEQMNLSRDDLLVRATDCLVEKVGTLTEEVQTMNLGILNLKKEVNKKPDDVELALVAIEAKRQRIHSVWQITIFSIIGTIIASTIATGIAVRLSQSASYKSCERNNIRLDVQVSTFKSVSTLLPDDPIKKDIVDNANKLAQLKTDCAKVFPIGH